MKNTTPNRTAACEMLIQSIHVAFTDLAATKADPQETNATLAFCEVAVSIPPSWFTPAERMMVAHTIESLYGDMFKFINDLEAGNVSFVNKCADLCNGRSVESFVEVMMRQHAEEFGTLA
jgi:hypothetical protein